MMLGTWRETSEWVVQLHMGWAHLAPGKLGHGGGGRESWELALAAAVFRELPRRIAMYPLLRAIEASSSSVSWKVPSGFGSLMAGGHVLAIWDPGDPHWSPQTTIFTPKISLFSLATFQEGKDQ